LKEGSWTEELTNHSRWARSGFIPNEERQEEIRCRTGPQCDEKGRKQWNSIEDRINERHQKGRQEFKRIEKLKNQGGYVEPRGDNLRLPPPEETQRPRCTTIWKIGSEQGEGPKQGSGEWLMRKNDCWKDEAMDLLGIKHRASTSEWILDWNEKDRAWRCAEFDIQYIRYPWPGKELEAGYTPEIAPDDQEAIGEMISQNTVFKEAEYAENLEDWLHLETNEDRRRTREEERERRIKQERADIEAVRFRMAAGYITDDHGLRIQMRERALGQWIAQIEADENQRIETLAERRTRERRQEIGDHRHFLNEDCQLHGIVRTIRMLQDGPELMEAIRRFWEDQYVEGYANPLAQARGSTLTLRAAVLREYEALGDEERRETGRELQVIHPHAPSGSSGLTGFPLGGVRSAGVAPLQE
jgi:hypothetical protein